MSKLILRLPAMVLTVLAAYGCRNPLGSRGSESSLERTLSQAIARELESIPPADDPAAGRDVRQTTRPQSDVLTGLAPRREELEAIGPLASGSQPRLELGEDLLGQPQQRIEVKLETAIATAVNRNLAVAATRLQPAISAAELAAAEAIFDVLLFGNIDLQKIDEPQGVPVITGFPLSTAFAQSESYRFETGVRKRFTPGTEAFISTDVTRFRNTAPGISFSPDPAYTSAVRLGLTQPLLRGFGSDVTTATIRIARNERQRSAEQYRSELLALVADVEIAYWDLLQAWRGLGIAEWLLDEGVIVRDTLARRRELDVTMAEYSDAVARVEQRRADVVRAQRQVRAASDALKVLMYAPDATIASEAVLYPIDDTTESPITYSLRETILRAVDNRPELDQAALNIEDESIREAVARNDLLPLLSASAQMAYFGLADSLEEAYSETGEGDFIDYILGLEFELPLGNNAAEANLRAARLRRTAAMLNYLRSVQTVILEVKSALRDVITNYELIEATRSFRIAQAENLRTLRVEEETLRGLTPEFLNLKFQRQETLAEARRQEVAALVEFDQSVAQLYRAMGIGLEMKRIEFEVIEPDEDDLELGDYFDNASATRLEPAHGPRE